jgi:hypothetical protein
MRGLTIAVPCALTTAAAAAPGDTIIHSADGLDFVVPKASPVTLNSKGHYAEFSFKGGFTLTGVLTYGLRTDESEEPAPVVSFVPDRASASVLPHRPGALADRLSFSNDDGICRCLTLRLPPVAAPPGSRPRRHGLRTW